MLKVLYEDDEILVVIKPAGVESQAAKRGRNLMWELSTDWTSLCPA